MKLVWNSGFDKSHLRCDCIKVSIVNGVRQPMLYSFVLNNAIGYEMFNDLNALLFRKIQ